MTKYKYRMIARITLEAISPLAVGSGEKDIITDAPVVRDVNDLPYLSLIHISEPTRQYS